jgi:WD40 repeat protein
VKVWDAQDEQQILTLQGHTNPVTAVAFSADGTRLTSISRDSVKIWDGRAGPDHLLLKGHLTDVVVVAFGPDDTHVSASDIRGVSKTWELPSGKEVRPTPAANLTGRPHRATSRDGRFLALAQGTSVRVVDTQLSDERRDDLQRFWADDPFWHKEQARSTAPATSSPAPSTPAARRPPAG